MKQDLPTAATVVTLAILVFTTVFHIVTLVRTLRTLSNYGDQSSSLQGSFLFQPYIPEVCIDSSPKISRFQWVAKGIFVEQFCSSRSQLHQWLLPHNIRQRLDFSAHGIQARPSIRQRVYSLYAPTTALLKYHSRRIPLVPHRPSEDVHWILHGSWNVYRANSATFDVHYWYDIGAHSSRNVCVRWRSSAGVQGSGSCAQVPRLERVGVGAGNGCLDGYFFFFVIYGSHTNQLRFHKRGTAEKM